MFSVKSIPTKKYQVIRLVAAHTFSTYLPSAIQHQKFLSMVKHQGEGKIYMNRLDCNVAEIVIDNPLKRGAISGKMMNDLARIVDELLESGNEPIGLLLRGTSNSFCAGADFNLAASLLTAREGAIRMNNFMNYVLNSIRNSSMISVCMINGPALGGGAELTTTCDYRIIWTNAKVCFVHAKVGASPGWGGGSRLCSIVGRKQAIRLLAGSHTLDAQEAKLIGFADAVADTTDSTDEEIRNTAFKFLEPFLKQQYPNSVSAAKAIVAAADSVGVSGGLTPEEARAVEVKSHATPRNFTYYLHLKSSYPVIPCLILNFHYFCRNLCF